MRRIKPGVDQLDLFTDPDAPYVPDRFIRATREPEYIDHENKAMQKPFISWDGEGYTDRATGRHYYWLLANSIGGKIIAPPGRSLERTSIARLFQGVQRQYPDAINTGFSLGYDFTMALRGTGIEDVQVRSIRERNVLEDSGYLWKIMAGKRLSVAEYSNKRESKTFTLFDTWGFFQTSFVKALDAYFGTEWPDTTAEERTFIIESKKQRANFDRNNDAEVQRYNDHELRLMVELMTELRERAYSAGLPLGAWYGPGAFASGLLQRHKVKTFMGPDLYARDDLTDAFTRAYAGGRFELINCGHVNGPMFQADVNSAYPDAISRLPCLAHGNWVHEWWDGLATPDDFGVFKVRFTTKLNTPDCAHITRSVPFPLWRRDPHGNNSFPADGVVGWYHGIEVKAAQRWCETPYGRKVGARVEIVESWTWAADCDHEPFAWVRDEYRKRQVLKRAGHGAHVAIKLALNSLYGKLAQQIGWQPGKDRKPPFHQLVWAGAVTATTRARMLDAACLDLESVIAFETDGIFTTEKLPLPYSTELGEWELTEYDDAWYFQSGFRFGVVGGNVRKPATRGVPAGDISLERIRETLSDCESTIEIRQTRFYTIRWAGHLNKPELIGEWDTVTRRMRMMQEDPRGKRVHDPMCKQCSVKHGKRVYSWDGLHSTIPAQGYEGTVSEPHPVLWVRWKHALTQLQAERRLLDNENDGDLEGTLFE